MVYKASEFQDSYTDPISDSPPHRRKLLLLNNRFLCDAFLEITSSKYRNSDKDTHLLLVAIV